MDKNYDNEEKQIQGGIVHDLNLRQRVVSAAQKLAGKLDRKSVV